VCPSGISPSVRFCDGRPLPCPARSCHCHLCPALPCCSEEYFASDACMHSSSPLHLPMRGHGNRQAFVVGRIETLPVLYCDFGDYLCHHKLHNKHSPSFTTNTFTKLHNKHSPSCTTNTFTIYQPPFTHKNADADCCTVLSARLTALAMG